jgi:NCS2 family nucleobase:cation symporter-2
MRYGADDPTPPVTTLLAALQYVSSFGAYVIFPLVVVRAAGVPAETAAAVIALSFVALGLATMVQATRGLGCGFLCPMVFTAAYVGPGIAAAKLGGLPLVFGMVAFAGLLEVLLSFAFRRIRFVFPAEVSGLVIMLVGLTIGDIAARNIVAMAAAGDLAGWLVLGTTFGLITLLGIWGSGAVARYAVLIGLAAGYALALLTGVVTEADLLAITAAPVMGLPSTDHLGWSFDPALAFPFAVGALAAATKAAALTSLAQGAAGPARQGDPAGTMARGMRGDGIATILAGLLGTIGVNPAPVSVAMARATGLASRRIAWAIGGVCLALALLPPFALVMARLPQPVLSGVLLFAGCLVLVNGMQMAVEAKLDTRRGMVVGLGIFAALAAQGLAGLGDRLPAMLAPILTSPFVLGSAVALAANLVLRIGSARRMRFVLADPSSPGALEAAWPPEAPVVARPAVARLVAEAARGEAGPVTVHLRFDEFGLRARLGRPGEAPLGWRRRQPRAGRTLAIAT